MKILRVILCGTALSFSGIHAAYVVPNHHDGGNFGVGIETLTGQTKETCVDFDEKDLKYPDHESSVSGVGHLSEVDGSYNQFVIDSYEKFDAFHNKNLSADIKSLTYSGDFSISDENKHKSSSTEFQVAIVFKKVLGQVLLNARKTKLQSEFQELQKNDPAGFERICGDSYISGAIKGQGLKILMSVTKKYAYDYHSFSSELNASAQGAAVSGKIHIGVKSAVEKLMTMGSVTIEITHYGMTKNNKGITAIINSKEDLSKVIETVASIIESSEHADSVTTDFIVSPYVNFFNKLGLSVVNEEKMRSLRRFYQVYRTLTDVREEYQIVIDNVFPKFPRTQVAEKYKRNFFEMKSKINDEIVKINTKAFNCSLAATDENDFQGLSRIEIKKKMFSQINANCTLENNETDYKNLFRIQPWDVVVLSNLKF